MGKNQVFYRHNNFDFGWSFTRDLPSLVTRYIDDHDAYYTTRAGNRCPYACADFDASAWNTVSLPHDWLVDLPYTEHALHAQGYVERDCAWYRKTFTLDEQYRDKQISLCFEGVGGSCEVYVNGSLLHRNFSSYNEFVVDLTDRVFYGERENCIAIFVDRQDIELWGYEGAGLYRHVHLYIKDSVHIAHNGLWAKSKPDNQGGWLLSAMVTVENSSYNPQPYCAAVVLKDPQGEVISSAEACGVVSGNGTDEAVISLSVPSPQLWDVDTPVLYTVCAEIKSNGLCDEETVTHGFRTFFANEHGFFLNDRPLMLKGICCHQGHAGVGNAVPDSISEYRIKKLKEMGVNAYRSAHQPHSRALLDACDRLGMLVMDENRHFETGKEYLQYLEDTVKRDRNHPSIVLYSLFNEEPLAATEQGKKIYTRLATTVRRLDDTRLLTGALNDSTVLSEDGASMLMDITGVNYDLRHFETFHARHPNQPMLGSENVAAFGTRGQYVTDLPRRMLACNDTEFFSYFNNMRETFEAIRDKEYVCGLFVWSGFDYRGEAVPEKWPAVASQFGLMDSCGFPKGGYYLLKCFYTTEPVMKILQHWNHTKGESITLTTVTNGDEVELLLNGRSLGKRCSNLYQQLEWTVDYEPGILEARAYRDGVLFATDMLETTSKAVRIRLTPDRYTLQADGADTVPVTVCLVDEFDRVLPCADDTVRFTVCGSGSFLGCGNGDPTDHDSDRLPVRRLFAGLCSVLVRAGKDRGTIQLTAQTDNLPPATIELTVE